MIRLLKMKIVAQRDHAFVLEICGEGESTQLLFSPEDKNLVIQESDPLADFLRENEYQLRKLLHNKRQDSFYIGFELLFSIIDGKDVAAYNDRSNILVVDGYGGIVGVKGKESKRELVEIYTDGSFNEKRELGGYAVLVRDLSGEYEAHAFTTLSQSSSLIELEAVIKALELVRGDVRIVTDSQYVRKGITEWIIHWKHNGWTTANGDKAKNIEFWKKLDRLCKNRYIELEWVKAHSNHFENDYCDYRSKQVTEGEENE